MPKDNINWVPVSQVPARKTPVKVLVSDKTYIGIVFCTPYEWMNGTQHFAVQVAVGATPTFTVGECEIFVEQKPVDEFLLGLAFCGQGG